MSDLRTVTRLDWFLDAPYTDVMMALTEDGSILGDVRQAITALRDRDPLLSIAHERLVTLEQRHVALVAALEVLIELLRVWQDDPQAGADEARRMIGATEDTLRDLVRQHRDERTPPAAEEAP